MALACFISPPKGDDVKKLKEVVKMRVKGNVSPATLSIEPYLPKEGYVEIRLRENIREVAQTDMQTNTTTTMFEYDEYTFYLNAREGLREDIESRLNDWLITGRTLEVDTRASAMRDAKQMNAEYEAALTEIEAALGVNT